MISVMVIDDDYRVARIHAAFVEQVDGFTVIGEAHSGAAALTQVRDHHPDLLLLDLYLPDIFGLDLLNTLRAEEYECDAIVITAAKEADAVRAAVRLGVVDYLLKPFAAEDLKIRLVRYASAYQLLAEAELTDQMTIDAALQHSQPAVGGSSPVRLPKGLSAETLDLVLSGLPESPATCSASECAAQVGISRVTARRYLEYLCETGSAEVSLRYGVSGRPERRFNRTRRSKTSSSSTI